MTEKNAARREDVLPFLRRIRQLPRRRIHAIGRYGVFWDSRRRPGANFNPLIFLLQSPESSPTDVRWIGTLEDAAVLIASGVDPDPASSPVGIPRRESDGDVDVVAEIDRLAEVCAREGLAGTAVALRSALAVALAELGPVR